MKKLSVIFLLFFISSTFGKYTYAEEDLSIATKSANNKEEVISVDPTPILNNDQSSTSGAVVDLNIRIDNSSAIMSPDIYLLFSRSDFQAAEAIDFEVINLEKGDYFIGLFDQSGTRIPVEIEEKFESEILKIKLYPPISFKPNIYKIKVLNSSNKILAEKQINWGFLSINFDNTTINPQDTVNIKIEALDQYQDLNCGAILVLKIISPSGTEEEFSTEKGTINKASDCSLHRPISDSNYSFSYKVKEIGEYKIILTDSSLGIAKTVFDSFTVENNKLSIQKIFPSRLHYKKDYDVLIKVRANEDFEGKLTELVSKYFDLQELENAKFFDEIGTDSAKYKVPSVLDNTTHYLTDPVQDNFVFTLGFGEDEPEEVRAKIKTLGLEKHDGLDFAVEEGSNVHAVDDGYIEDVRNDKTSYGLTVVVKHQWGRTYYGHLSRALFEVGQNISKGTIIALSGNTGISTGPHLHFSLEENSLDKKNGYFGKIDPQNMLPATVLNSFSTKKLVWNLKLKKGEEIVLGYKINTSNPKLQYYFTGKTGYLDNSNQSFESQRVYQTVLDKSSIALLNGEKPDLANEKVLKILSQDGSSVLLLENKLTNYQSLWVLQRLNGESWQRIASQEELMKNSVISFKEGSVFWLSPDGNALNGYQISGNSYFSQTIDKTQEEESQIAFGQNKKAFYKDGNIAFMDLQSNEELETDDNEIENIAFAQDFLGEEKNNPSLSQMVAGVEDDASSKSAIEEENNVKK